MLGIDVNGETVLNPFTGLLHRLGSLRQCIRNEQRLMTEVIFCGVITIIGLDPTWNRTRVYGFSSGRSFSLYLRSVHSHYRFGTSAMAGEPFMTPLVYSSRSEPHSEPQPEHVA